LRFVEHIRTVLGSGLNKLVSQVGGAVNFVGGVVHYYFRKDDHHFVTSVDVCGLRKVVAGSRLWEQGGG